MNFDKPPQPPQTPKYTPEKLTEYLRETDVVLSTGIKVLVRGFEDSTDVYKPWPKAEVQKSLDSLLAMSEVKIKYYEGADNAEGAKKASEEVAELKEIFSEIDSSEEVPEGFLQRVKIAVESSMNLPENFRDVLDDSKQSTPQVKISTRESSVESNIDIPEENLSNDLDSTIQDTLQEKRSTQESSKETMDAIASIIDDLIQAYAKILRSKVEANSASTEIESVKLERSKLLFPIIANLEKTHTALLDAFNGLRVLELDDETIRGIIKATLDTGKKLEKLNF